MSISRIAGPAIAILIIATATAWMLSGEKTQEESTAASESSTKSLIPSVQIVRSESREVQQSLDINGITEAKRFVTLRSEGSGKVILLAKKNGDSVKKGEVIARLDLQDIPARIKQAKAFEEQARLEYEGAKKLQGQGLQNEAQLAGKLASYEQAKAQLASLELQSAHTYLTAPFSGQIEDLNIELGSFIRQGDSIANIYDYSQLKFVGSVSENDVASLNIGQAARVELISGDQVNATVSYIGSVTNPATRTFKVEMTIANVDRNISGVTSVASVALNNALGHFVSPALLYVNESGQLGLKTVNDVNEVEFYEISTIKSDTKGIWLDGLPPQSNIIIVGQGFVNVGDEVKTTEVAFDSNVAVGL